LQIRCAIASYNKKNLTVAELFGICVDENDFSFNMEKNLNQIFRKKISENFFFSSIEV
jgi:hypothetical protein